MVNKNCKCCHSCFSYLFLKNAFMAALWLKICEQFYQNEVVLAFERPEYIDLENMGYITTTDFYDLIIIRPNGCDPNNDEPFCINRRVHSNE